MLNRLSFQINSDEYYSWILPVIDNLPLTDLVTTYEQDNGYTDPVGGYGPIRNSDFDTSRDKMNILACECGETGCWPLQVIVTVQDDLVVWSDFSQPYRPQRSYKSFGPFQFSRKDYEAAITGLYL